MKKLFRKKSMAFDTGFTSSQSSHESTRVFDGLGRVNPYSIF